MADWGATAVFQVISSGCIRIQQAFAVQLRPDQHVPGVPARRFCTDSLSCRLNLPLRSTSLGSAMMVLLSDVC